MDARKLVPGDVLEHTEIVDPADRSTRQRLVVVAVLRLGLRLQPLSRGGLPAGSPLLLGYEHAGVVRRAA